MLFGTSLQGAVRISEFLAVNDGLLEDEDLESPDWIEIHNTGPGAVDLGGWHLTDNPWNLTKWTFPSTSLLAGDYLVVFASGKNRAVSGAELHTSFTLSGGTSYLALVEPGGATIAHAYDPEYPNQRFNVSYGVVSGSPATALLSAGAAARVLVPTDGALGLTWTEPGFDDGSWLLTNTPVGFAAATTPGTVLALDVNDRDADPGTTTQPGFSAFVIDSVGGSSAIQNDPVTRVYGDISVTISNLPGYGYDDRLRTDPANSGDFTESLLLRDFLFSRDNAGTSGLDILISGLSPNQDHRITIWGYDGGSPNSRVSDWWANGVPVVSNYTCSGSIPPTSNDDYRFSFDAPADGAGEILVSGRRDTASDTFAVWVNALQVDALETLSPTNWLADLMVSNNATAYLRIPFTVDDPDAFQALNLRVKYDDGFLAYVNGQLVASRNAPGTPQWDSAATAAHGGAPSQVFENMLIANTPGLLIRGANVLAIHGLNVSAQDETFLIHPELEGLHADALVERYFASPTPGTANGTGFPGLVADTKFSVDRGFYDAPVSVAITSATPSASIYWTTDGSIPSPSNGNLYVDPIQVSSTTFLRAAAFLADYVPSVPDTHTYIFLSEVLQQPSNPPGYPMVWQADYPADYEMDPNVVNHPTYSTTISNDLRSIPTLSIVSTHDAFWDPATGIYVDATKQGDAYEHQASAELFNGDNTSEFQINCEIQMQGAASRDNVRLAKHSFRLQFTSAYGPSKLDYDWYDGPRQRFDHVTLRACFTDAWPTRANSNRYRPHDSLYLRDVWVKEALRDMGHLSGRGDFVHLYVNGLYWGLYNPTERLGAEFFEGHLGGYEADWDVIRDYNELLDGSRSDWDALINMVNTQGVDNETEFQAVADLVDIDNLIDYVLLHIVAEAEDWLAYNPHNWYGAHRRANPATGLPATKWIFLPWDQEIVFNRSSTFDRVNVSADNSPARIYSKSRSYHEFRRMFGDRVQKHMFNGGALTASNNTARLQALANRVDRAIVGESARWGDAREFTIGVNPGHGETFTRDEWWIPELNALYNDFFPNSMNQRAITRLQDNDLFPTVQAPELSQFGGAVPDGYSLLLTNPNGSGAIYYTIDGTDPRTYGSGFVAPTAISGGGPVTISGPTLVRARVLSSGAWSALIETTFYPPQDLTGLSLTEIMYHPPAFNAMDGDELEFLELKNFGTNTINLTGLTFTEGINYTFPVGTVMAPGQIMVLARNTTAFAARYPGVSVDGVYTGRLSNDGETLRLSHALGTPIFKVTYDDQPPWPTTPDIVDFSLVPRAPGEAQAADKGGKWRASTYPGGSPGADDPVLTEPGIVISEILSHTDPPEVDAIELFNPTPSNVNVGGWYLSDEAGYPTKFEIPDPTVILPGGYVVFDETDFNPTPGYGTSFALSSMGDEAHLFSAAADGKLTGYSHGTSFEASFTGVSFGRHVTSDGLEHHPSQASGTLGWANAGPLVGPVVISEIQYHPSTGEVEFVELQNITGSPVTFYDPAYPENTWKLSGVGYTFPTNAVLDAGAMMLVVPTNPAVFRVLHGVSPSVQIFGPYPGQLQDSGENLELQAPDTPDTNGVGALVVPHVVIDTVRYNDKAPWPPGADGSGMSLQRQPGAAYGNEPLNWTAAGPTPGQVVVGGDSDGDGLPDAWEAAHGTYVYVPDKDEDPDADGLTNTEEYLCGTHPNDPSSTLKLQGVSVDGDTLTLQFPAQSNRSYSVLYRHTLAEPTWTKLVDIPVLPTTRQETVTNEVSGDAHRFFFVVTPSQP